MNILGTCRAVDALRELGIHNTKWRAHREITDAFEAVDFAMTYYSIFMDRIFAAIPFGCVRAEIVREDIAQLFLYTGSPAAELRQLHSRPDSEGEYVRTMASADSPVVGPLMCACRGIIESDALRLQPPVLIFDGFHRTSAWMLRQEQTGKNDPISANIILTRKDFSDDPTR